MNKKAINEIEFSDGMKFDTSGELRMERRSDGLYVVGKGMLIPVDSVEEAKATIKKFGGTVKENKKIKTKKQIVKETLQKLKDKGMLDEKSIKKFIKIQESREYYNGKGTFDFSDKFDNKDKFRIEDIVEYSKGDKDKATRLAQNMANKITDGNKALRRAAAAVSLGYKNLASIFKYRANQLGVA